MALYHAWWLEESHVSRSVSVPDQPHHGWPWSLPSNGVPLKIVELRLQESANSQCDIHVLHYAWNKHPQKWVKNKHIKSAAHLVEILKEPLPPDINSVFYVVRSMNMEAIQALGYYLKITTRYFNMPASGRTLGAPREGHEDKKFAGLIEIDPIDNLIAQAFQILMTREGDTPFGATEQYAGLGKVISELFFIVQYTWSIFLQEAEQHLQVLSENGTNIHLTQAKQLSLRSELHHLSRLWLQVKRLIVSTKHTAEQLTSHPFFAQINGTDGRPVVASLLDPQIRALDDQITCCNDLSKQTDSLDGLIFNISQLQDTRAAVEEGKAANALASSIRRVTMLTFVYLPLTLASSIFGMNIAQITGESANPGLWMYFVVSGTLMAATFAGWFVWSRTLSGLERRAGGKALENRKRDGFGC